MILPTNCKGVWFVSTKCTTNPIPRLVIQAYMTSEIVAPIPVANPCHCPLLSVLCIHNIPTGPMGAETNIPIITPLTNISIIIPSSAITH